jgi:hypothetical protein
MPNAMAVRVQEDWTSLPPTALSCWRWRSRSAPPPRGESAEADTLEKVRAAVGG